MESSIERKYHEVLRSTATKFGLDYAPEKELPYLLEKISIANLNKNTRYILSGISGSGKTTVAKILEKKGFKKLRNITTRAKRSEEKNSDAIFVTEKTFKDWKQRNLIFHPHRRNKVWQGVLINDLEKFAGGDDRYYADKSVAASIEMIKNFPIESKTTFIYLLPPTFKELNARITKREDKRRNRNENAISKRDILDRFEEEISDMRKAIKIPYAYVVNDFLGRINNLIRKRL